MSTLLPSKPDDLLAMSVKSLLQKQSPALALQPGPKVYKCHPPLQVLVSGYLTLLPPGSKKTIDSSMFRAALPASNQCKYQL